MMMKSPIKILATKKLTYTQRQDLLDAGLTITDVDFIGTNFKDVSLKDIKGNLIFTSQNGFKSFLENKDSKALKNRKVFCVGRKTSEIIAKEGFKVVASADYAEQLSKIIIDKHSKEDFTFLSGNLRRDVLPNTLTAAGVKFTEIEVYETVHVPHKVNPDVNAILFFSPSGVESFLKKNTVGTATCFCIGATNAASLKGMTEDIVVAGKPSVESVISKCISHYSDKN